jgi:DNA-binding MarR family transcriptional regulator
MKEQAEIRKLDSIADSLLMFFPLIYRNMLGSARDNEKATHLNMEVRAMFMLQATGILSTSDIGRKLGISKPNVTSLLDKLVAKGYVERLPDGNDRRVIRIAVTHKGKSFINKKSGELRNVMKSNMSVLKHDEIDALFSSLETVRDIISRMGGRN